MQKKVAEIISEFVLTYREHTPGEAAWQTPLVAFAAADDPLFTELRERVSPTHAVPCDFMQEARTVISFFVPFSQDIPESNRGSGSCSYAWAVAYIETNRLIADINNHVQKELGALGYNSTIIPATHNFDEARLVSDWSHRHVAYIAGLGKFGLNNMLITAKGCCGRVGSIVTDLPVPSTSRSSKEACLYKANGSCRMCVGNCSTGALTGDGFNRHKCYELCLKNAEKFAALGLADVCGKCLVGLPCSFTDPVSHS